MPALRNYRERASRNRFYWSIYRVRLQYGFLRHYYMADRQPQKALAGSQSGNDSHRQLTSLRDSLKLIAND